MTYPNKSNQYLPGTIQIPPALQITSITQTKPQVVTTLADPITQQNTYIAGQLVKLNIPYGYGMQQAQGLVGQITSVSGNNLSLNINSTNFDPFSIPSSGEQPASLAPYGSRNLQFSN